MAFFGVSLSFSNLKLNHPPNKQSGRFREKENETDRAATYPN